MDTLKPTSFVRIASLLRRFDVRVLLVSLILYTVCLVLFVDALKFLVMFGFLTPIIVLFYLAILGVEHGKVDVSVIFKYFALLSLPILLVYCVFIVFPVYWSGLRCDQQWMTSCDSVRDIPFHTHKLLSYETMHTLVLFLDLFVFIFILVFSIALLFRFVIVFRSLPRNTALFQVVCLLFLQLSIIIAFDASSALGAWYE